MRDALDLRGQAYSSPVERGASWGHDRRKEEPMRGEPFPMSLWERAVLEGLERIEAAVQRWPIPATAEPRTPKREQTVPMKPSNLMALQTWAEASGMSRQQAYNLARQGRIPVIWLGRRIFVHLATMAIWVERGARPDDLVHFELSDGSSVTRLRDDLEERL
jgi:hypothetical protein